MPLAWAAGWPKPLEVIPARIGKLRASIKGDALYGTVCGRDYTLTLTTADQFGNPRCELRTFRKRQLDLPHSLRQVSLQWALYQQFQDCSSSCRLMGGYKPLH